MTKKEFIARLRKKLRGLSKQEREERLTFYEEAIDDRIEDGLLEEDAVAAVGKVDDVARQVMGESDTEKPAKEKRSGVSTAFIIIGSPIWLALLIAVFAVAIALYVCVWAIVIVLWAVFVSFVVGAPTAIIVAIILVCQGKAVIGVGMLGCACALAGLAIATFFVSVATTKGVCSLSKKLVTRKKNANKGVE